ncbi:hypothetical protein ACI48D_12150 [Massilia sp. LXY-6]|uniref:hypothetical protein n=1 Tax=Massilia sp. LXY-6 TaxID=3379823 RepID=UPI003EE295C0
MPLRSIATAFIAALAGLAPLAAQASATGHIVQGPLTWTLVDLRPDDGIAPSLVFQPIPYGKQSPGAINISIWSNGSHSGIDKMGDGSGALSADYTDGLHSGFGRMSGAGPGSPRLEAGASTTGTGTAGAFDMTDSQVNAPFLQFLLGPGTGVVLSAAAHATGKVSDLSTDEYARAQLDLEAGLYFGNGNASFWSDGAQLEASTSSGKPSFDDELRRSLTFGNGTDAAAYGYIATDVLVWTRAASTVAAVPEPAAAWMLAPGLVLVGGALRRRAQIGSVASFERRTGAPMP